jgi:hypothetical protein
MEFVLIIAVLGGMAWIRFSLHFSDKARIEAVARTKGWSDIRITWTPFAPGWFGAQGERLYCISYLDEAGAPGRANCKTGLWTGVYWRDEGS